MEIRPFRAGDEQRLRQVARASKAHWGYDAERVSAWAAALEYAGKDVWIADEGGPVGYATLIVADGLAELDELWVEPSWIGRGVGSELFQVRRRARRVAGSVASRMGGGSELDRLLRTDGSTWLCDSPPSESGRILPVMGIEL